jgi:hypothetical protein
MLMRKPPVFARVWQRVRRCARPRLPSRSIAGEPLPAAGSADRTGTGVAGSPAGLRRRSRRPAGRRSAPGCTAARRRPDAPDTGVAGGTVGRGAVTRADGIAFHCASSQRPPAEPQAYPLSQLSTVRPEWQSFFRGQKQGSESRSPAALIEPGGLSAGTHFAKRPSTGGSHALNWRVAKLEGLEDASAPARGRVCHWSWPELPGGGIWCVAGFGVGMAPNKVLLEASK